MAVTTRPRKESMLFTGTATEVMSGSPDEKMVLGVFLLEFLTVLKFSGFRQQNKSCVEIVLFFELFTGIQKHIYSQYRPFYLSNAKSPLSFLAAVTST